MPEKASDGIHRQPVVNHSGFHTVWLVYGLCSGANSQDSSIPDFPVFHPGDVDGYGQAHFCDTTHRLWVNDPQGKAARSRTVATTKKRRPAMLSPWMKLLVHFLQARLVNVRVDLSRGDAGVSKHFLHLPQVGSADQHVRGKTVTQRVGADGCGGSDPVRVFFDQLPNRFAPQPPAAARQKEPSRRS